MTETEIDRAVKKLVGSCLADEDDIVGCSEAEIEELEEKFGVSFPAAYVEFLRRMGKQCGAYFEYETFLYPALRYLTPRAQELIDEKDMEIELTETDFVFSGHEGYTFLYFDTEESEDPAVYRIHEDDDEPDRAFNTFTGMLLVTIMFDIERKCDVSADVTVHSLHDALMWVGEEPNDRTVEIGLGGDGDSGDRYRIRGTFEHELTGLSDDQRERLREVCGELGLRVLDEEGTDSGFSVTLQEDGALIGQPFDTLDDTGIQTIASHQLEILVKVLWAVHGADIDDIQDCRRLEDDAE